ncbi:PREDICTED: uncharacterized protein LOC104766236 [Camelina sativa]|uniref:Uncharacterized protein LOC104766236 n=1 Tax=Camelina sativa TaxID=90675 RepID=A0ABM0XN49_CAMSA|nr:PREDICTED: uncharacterized protein LOC104766236 [Camelina sativa]
MESSSNHMTCLLKIESPMPGWKKSMEKLLKTINDVSFMIDKRSKTVYVSGKVDPQIILEKITKAGKNAVIIWSSSGTNKQPENRTSGYMNAPNGFSNYPPPNYWMNQPQPYMHALPPAPAPYKFHQNEPVAKSFPPTPPPPKNFVMGDLQPGCKIM